jgi:hypothetical protein
MNFEVKHNKQTQAPWWVAKKNNGQNSNLKTKTKLLSKLF